MKYIKLIRVSNWLKNAFVLAPLVFSLKLFENEAIQHSLFALIAFCLISSCVYILNDLVDIEADRLHPRKKFRPLPAGTISKTTAITIFSIFLVSGISLSYTIGNSFLALVLSYLIGNFLYSFWLKKINLIESFCIGVFFVIRVVAGCYAINVFPSHWIIIITFSIALFLTFIKRKSELLSIKQHEQHRAVLQYYTAGMLDKFIFITATITITGYLLYTINDEVLTVYNSNLILYSSIFVFLGIFRFVQISQMESSFYEGDPTTLLLKDRFSQITIIAYIIFIVSVIYFT